MSEIAWLAVYCVLVLFISLVGGHLPFLGRVTHRRLQLYLSLSAGVMLGAAFFHILPDALERSGPYFGWWMSLAVIGLFCIERFIAPHSHEIALENNHHHYHYHDHEEKSCSHSHHVESAVTPGPKDQRPAAPAVAGWMAVLGLTIHTFMNGVGLGGAVHFDVGLNKASALAGVAMVIPGLALFLAIFFHKPADALAISVVLSRKGESRRTISWVQLGFAAMVPIGAAAFFLTEGRIKEDLENQLTGAALAFSGGTFLFIALSDLLPEVQFHGHDRIPLFLALVLGVVLMGGIALLEDHDPPASASKVTFPAGLQSSQ